MSIPGLLFDFVGKEIGEAVGKEVATKAGQQAGDAAQTLTETAIGGGVDKGISSTPSELVVKKSADIINDGITGALHHVPIFKQLLDGIDDAVATIPESKANIDAVWKDLTTTDKTVKDSMKEHFGTEDIGNVDSGLKQLRNSKYRPSIQEQNITRNLVKRQDKVFDLLKKYRNIAKKGGNEKYPLGVNDPLLQKEMNAEITEVFSRRAKNTKSATHPNGTHYLDELNLQKKNIIDHVYDYPKNGQKITAKQRENVFSAIEKDVDTHTSGTVVAKVPKFKITDPSVKNSSQDFLKTHAQQIKDQLNISDEIKSGNLYIDDTGALKIFHDGSNKISGGTTGGMAIGTYTDMIGDVVANSDRIPEETKEMLLKDFTKAKTKSGKSDRVKVRGRQIWQGKVSSDTGDVNKSFLRDAKQKSDFNELKQSMGDLSDLSSVEIESPTNTYGTEEQMMEKTYHHLLPEANIEESAADFAAKTPPLSVGHMAELELIGGKIGKQNELSNWKDLSTIQRDRLQLLKDKGADIKSPDMNKAEQYKKLLESKKNLTKNEKRWLDQAHLSTLDYEGNITQDFERFRKISDRAPDAPDEKPALASNIKGLFDTKPASEGNLKTKTGTITETVAAEAAPETPEIPESGGRKVKETPEEKGTRELAERKAKIADEEVIRKKQISDRKNDKARRIQFQKQQEISDKASNEAETERQAKLSIEDAADEAKMKQLKIDVVEKYGLNVGEHLDKSIFNVDSLKAITKGIRYAEEDVPLIKDKVLNNNPAKINNLFSHEFNLIKKASDEEENLMLTMLRKADLKPSAVKDTSVKALEAETDPLRELETEGTGEKKGTLKTTPSSLQTQANKQSVKLDTDDTFSGALDKIASESKTASSTTTPTNPAESLAPLEVEEALEKELPERLTMDDTGVISIKDIGTFRQLSEFSDEYKNIVDFVGGKRKLEDIIFRQTGGKEPLIEKLPELVERDSKTDKLFITDIDKLLQLNEESEQYKVIENLFGGKEKLDDLIEKQTNDKEFFKKSADKVDEKANVFSRIFSTGEQEQVADLAPDNIKNDAGMFEKFKEGAGQTITDLRDDPANEGKSFTDLLKDNKGKILGGGLATAAVGTIIGEEAKIGDAIGGLSDATKEGTDTITKTITSDGDSIKKKLEDIEDTDGKNTAIAQIITSADSAVKDDKDDPDGSKERGQIANGMKDIERQIQQLAMLQSAKASTITQINDPTPEASTNRANRRDLKDIEFGLTSGRRVLNRKAQQLSTDLKVVNRRKKMRKNKKDAIQQAKDIKDKKLEQALTSGVLKQSQPVINIVNNNQSKFDNLRDYNVGASLR